MHDAFKCFSTLYKKDSSAGQRQRVRGIYCGPTQRSNWFEELREQLNNDRRMFVVIPALYLFHKFSPAAVLKFYEESSYSNKFTVHCWLYSRALNHAHFLHWHFCIRISSELFFILISSSMINDPLLIKFWHSRCDDLRRFGDDNTLLFAFFLVSNIMKGQSKYSWYEKMKIDVQTIKCQPNT